MRTALILLLVLAVAAVPGSVLAAAQRQHGERRRYLRRNPSLGPWLDRLSAFDVYSSPWFSAVYLLLFISLVGCLVPRLRQHAATSSPAARRAGPPGPAAALGRRGPRADATAAAAAAARALGRGGGPRSGRPTAGHRRGREGVPEGDRQPALPLRPAGLLVGVACGRGTAGTPTGSWWPARSSATRCSSSTSTAWAPAPTPATCPAFCVTVQRFQAEYLETRPAVAYTADISYVDVRADADQPWTLRSTIRCGWTGQRLPARHGYAPVLRFTDRTGRSFTPTAPFLPTDGMLTSTGAFKFQDANVPRRAAGPTSSRVRRDLLPTAAATRHGASSVPGGARPGADARRVRGEPGLGSGARSRSTTSTSARSPTASWRSCGTERCARARVDAAGRVHSGVSRHPAVDHVSVRHDPGEPIVLVGPAALLVGLMVSLSGKRRRCGPGQPGRAGGSLITLGGLARTEYSGLRRGVRRVDALAGDDDRVRPLA
jgi:cytochrome c biogenesis protein